MFGPDVKAEFSIGTKNKTPVMNVHTVFFQLVQWFKQ